MMYEYLRCQDAQGWLKESLVYLELIPPYEPALTPPRGVKIGLQQNASAVVADSREEEVGLQVAANSNRNTINNLRI